MTWFAGFGRRGIVAVVVLLGLCALSLPAVAKSLEQIRREKAKAAARAQHFEARGDSLADKVASLDAERARIETQVNRLQGELDRLDADIQDAKRRLTAAQKHMAVLTAELQEILAELGTRTDLFVDRAVAAYKAGPTAYVEGVLSSESFTDLVDRYTYYESALDADSGLMDDIEVLRDELEMRRLAVEEKQQEIARAKLGLQQDRSRVSLVHEQHAGALAEQRAIVAAKENLLAGVRDKARRQRAIVAQFEKEEAQKLAIIRAAGSSSSGPLPSGGGQLAWPAAGPVTSGFGYRTHPIFGGTRFHSGIDIGAPYGAPVVAAAGGQVIFVGVMSGYGNAIVVDHGGGLATTYNHLSAFFVGSGQSVSRSSQIGAVGCTGYCTGPHLHFEVRVNGNPVDPMPYLQ